MFIYRYTNQINGKIYVGKTCRTLKQRHNQHVYDSKKSNPKSIFYKAIQKYGWEQFYGPEILEKVVTKDDLTKQEKYWIDKLNSFFLNEKGYNMTLGGDGGNGRKGIPLSEEHKQNISKAQKGKPRKSWGHHTKKYRKQMSSNYSGEGNPAFGTTHSEDHKQKISESLKKAYQNGTRSTKISPK